MGIIQKLPQIVINKIAAGEVIERPASVVKELVENAIDAQATFIEVFLEQGGKKLIRVTDNGSGMSAEDLAMAVESHATSKLRDSDDLFFVTTMGFRGEALPSIGAVSHVHIVSRLHDSPEGHEIDVRGAEISPVKAAGCPEGTSVEIRNLFFNVPARRKFLRTDTTELGHVSDMMTKLALAFPAIHFRLTHGNRQLFDAPPEEDRARRLEKFFGRGMCDALIPIDAGRGSMSLAGFVAPPSESRASGKLQYVFLNGRFIQDRFISAAIREAYKGMLTVGRRPVVFLFLQVDPREVDVNVHPSKVEVRFRNAQAIYIDVLNAIRDRLDACDLRPEIGRDSEHPLGDPSERVRPERPAPSGAPAAQQAQMPADFFVTPGPAEADAGSGAVQLHDSYIVEQQADAIVITDQHALHERILYEQINQRLNSARLESQRMLMPVTVELAPDEVLALLGSKEELGRLGIGVEEFGKNVIAVQSLPAIIGDSDVQELIREILAALHELGPDEPVEKLRENLMQTIACKGAVKAGQRLNRDEILSLVKRRNEMAQPGANPPATCPHGRPYALKLTLETLEKHFKRR